MSDKLDKQQRAALMFASTPEDGVRLLAGLPAKDAYDLLFESPEPEKVVALIPAETLYLLLHEIGASDALALLEFASTEQVQSFFDIDCWDRDRLSMPKTRTWMLLLNEIDDESFIRHVREMDLAMLVCFFRQHLDLYKIENIDDEITQDGGGFLTPDGRHLIIYTCGDKHAQLINALLMRTYILDFNFFMLLIEAIYWETTSEVEETAYQERVNRLEYRGFPDFYAALEILATVDVAHFAPPRKLAPPPIAEAPGAPLSGSTYLTRFEHAASLLRRLLAENFLGCDDIAVEIMRLANMAIVADQTSFVEIERVRRLVARTDGFLNIGLQYLAGDELAAGRETLLNVRAIDLHKIGRSLVVALARRARALLPHAALDRRSADRLLLDGPERDLVYGLMQKDLLRLSNGREEFWTELQQVRAAEIQLTVIERFVGLMHDGLGFTPDFVNSLPLIQTNIGNPAELPYRVLFNTFRCHDLLGRTPAPTALSRADLDALAERLVFTAGGRPEFPAAVRATLREWLAAQAGEPVGPLWTIFARFDDRLSAELSRTDLPPHLRHEVLTKVGN
jgi:hypothetical protein